MVSVACSLVLVGHKRSRNSNRCSVQFQHVRNPLGDGDGDGDGGQRGHYTKGFELIEIYI